jgi:hypothetical protein
MFVRIKAEREVTARARGMPPSTPILRLLKHRAQELFSKNSDSALPEIIRAIRVEDEGTRV